MDASQSIDSLISLSDILPNWTVAFAIASGLYFVAGWYSKKHVSKEAKESLSLWLWGDFESSWTEQFCNTFDALFGKRHVSLKCFIRSALFSLLSVLLFSYLFFSSTVIAERAGGGLSLLETLLGAALFNIIPDYISLFETRWLLQQLHKVRSFWVQFSILVLDAIFTATIFWLAINAVLLLLEYQPISILQLIGVYGSDSIFFYSTFITSIWAWLYCISTWIIRFFSESPIKNLLATEEKPVEQVALVCAIFLFLAILPLQMLISSSDRSEVSAFDEIACHFSPATCVYVARIIKDDSIANQFMERSCDASDYKSCTILGFWYETTSGDSKNVYKARKLYQRACDGGYLSGCIVLGRWHELGLGGIKDVNKAHELYQKACDGDYSVDCQRLVSGGWDWDLDWDDDGSLDLPNKPIKPLRKTSETDLRHGCDGGNFWNCIILGERYEKGNGVTKDFSQAQKLYQRACYGGELAGCKYLGEWYEKEFGDKDFNKARELYQYACDESNHYGCENLGILYEKGLGGTKNFSKARELYQRTCYSSYDSGCNSLGILYERGLGGPKDFRKARELFRRACILDLDWADGCRNLGRLYEKGLGGLKDFSKAQKLYQRAREYDGFITAGGNGTMRIPSKPGLGGPKDFSKAQKLYQRASEYDDFISTGGNGTIRIPSKPGLGDPK